MDLEELKQFLIDNKDIMYCRPDNDLNGLFLYSKRWDETIRIDLRKLCNITKEQILFMLCDGKDVEQMTRVTGYFSKTNYWNKGKLAELRDRYRIKGGF